MALYLGSTKMAVNLSGSGAGGSSENLDAELTAQESLISQLSTILDSKASGGSGNGAYTGQIHFDGPAVINFFVAYLDSDMAAQVITPTTDCSITVAANTIITVPSGNMAVASQGCTKIASDSMVSVFHITSDDFVVTIQG